MNNVWQLQEAKSKLSEVVDRAIEEGPQVITRRGVETAVVISFKEYQKFKPPSVKLSEFFRTSPLGELDLTRDPVPPRPDLEL